MGAYVIRMPDIGEGIAEVELVEWHVQVGDAVVEDQILADVMTDKATVQVPSPVHGRVSSLGGKVGEVMAVGAELIRIEVEGAGNVGADDTQHAAASNDIAPGAGKANSHSAVADTAHSADVPEALASAMHSGQQSAAEGPRATAATVTGSANAAVEPGTGAPAAVEVEEAPEDAATSSMPAAKTDASAIGGCADSSAPSRSTQEIPRPALRPSRPLASPAVRRRAEQEGIDLRLVPGTGPVGQIQHEDLDRWVLHGGRLPVAPASAPGRYGMPVARSAEVEEIPVVGLRRKIAQKMQQSKRQIPHFTYVEEVDVTELEALRQRLNARWGGTRGKLTLLPFLARALVLGVREFPQVNARYDDEKGVVQRYAAVHLGVAAQTDAGLMVPVLRHAESHDLWSCANEIRRLAEAARQGTAQRDELSGSTITISSLGALGGIVATPVINYPEVAIVGVNRVVERPVVANGAIVVRKMMNLSSSFDHRIIDGMHAAEFIQCIRAYLECPSMLFVE